MADGCLIPLCVGCSRELNLILLGCSINPVGEKSPIEFFTAFCQIGLMK